MISIEGSIANYGYAAFCFPSEKLFKNCAECTKNEEV
jgi:hypothetical protein